MNVNKYPYLKKQVFYHVIAWMAFIVYEVSIVLVVEGATGHYSPARFYIIPYLLNILLFYVHAHVLLNHCFHGNKRKTLVFALLVVLELGLYIYLISLLQSRSQPKKRYLIFYFNNDVLFARTTWRGIYFMLFSTAYWFITRSFRRVQLMKEIEKKALIEEKERQRLELALVSSQNAFLQAQINPHFLFNALNFIHSEVQEVSENASEAVIILSDMMRYSLIENKMDGKVPLEKEIQQIENVIKINQYRFDNRLSLRFLTSGDFDSIRIAPLLLAPFVENLFKYADLTDSSNPALIKLQAGNGFIVFSTLNKKRKTVSFSSPGIGINNIRTRLESLYADRYSLLVEDADTSFSVYLKIIF